MDNVISVGLAGLLAQSSTIDATAANLANLDTAGYGSRATTVTSGPSELVRNPNTILAGQTLAPGASVQIGPSFSSDTPTFSNGITPTGQPYDLAINGSGFFQVQGANGQVYYTRDGAFAVDANGNLVTQQGDFVLPHIVVPAGATAAISSTGVVTVEVNGTPTVLGQLTLARVPNPSSLEDIGNGLYQPSANTGTITTGTPGAGGLGTILPGTLNASGTDVASTFVTMIQAETAYQMAAKLMTVGQVLDKATTQMA
jgi:flagellar basal-body rod protein FlgG